MILGAIADDPKKRFNGRYKPEEFGKLTLWQLKNLFDFKPSQGTALSIKEAFWKRNRILGLSEFEIWRKWTDEVKEEMERIEQQAEQRNPIKHF